MAQDAGLPSALLLLCVPGCLAVALSGPHNVTGTVGKSLRVQCQYEEKFKIFTKYWCRQPCLPFWNQLVETSGPEGEGSSSRVSIMDHSGNLTFTVTLENLTVEDAGKYWCGIATVVKKDEFSDSFQFDLDFFLDPVFQVQVLVCPGPCSETLTSCSSYS